MMIIFHMGLLSIVIILHIRYMSIKITTYFENNDILWWLTNEFDTADALLLPIGT